MANKALRIRELCKQAGITQAELAQRLGVSPTTFSQALARNKFGLDRLAEIADILNVEIPDLFVAARPTLRCPHCGKAISVLLT